MLNQREELLWVFLAKRYGIEMIVDVELNVLAPDSYFMFFLMFFCITGSQNC